MWRYAKLKGLIGFQFKRQSLEVQGSKLVPLAKQLKPEATVVTDGQSDSPVDLRYRDLQIRRETLERAPTWIDEFGGQQ